MSQKSIRQRKRFDVVIDVDVDVVVECNMREYAQHMDFRNYCFRVWNTLKVCRNKERQSKCDWQFETGSSRIGVALQQF